MSDMQPPAPEPESPAAPNAVAPTPPAPVTPVRSKLPIVAAILAGLGFLMAVVPASAGLAWLVIIPAIVVAIVALVKKARPTGLSIAAIVVAPIAWLIAIIVSIVGIAASVSSLPDSNSASQPAEAEGEEEPADDGIAALGETVTNSDGVAVTFSAVTCGLAKAGEEYFEETAKGQFCEVKYSVQNGSDEAINLWSTDVTGDIGGAEYEANGSVSTFGGEYFTTELNPGLGTDAVAYIDIPADKALDYVVFVPEWSILTSEIRVKVS